MSRATKAQIEHERDVWKSVASQLHGWLQELDPGHPLEDYLILGPDERAVVRKSST